MGMMFKNGIPYAGVPDEIDAATVGGHTVEADVPADAAFTDTVYDDTQLRKDISNGDVPAGLLGSTVTETELITALVNPLRNENLLNLNFMNKLYDTLYEANARYFDDPMTTGINMEITDITSWKQTKEADILQTPFYKLLPGIEYNMLTPDLGKAIRIYSYSEPGGIFTQQALNLDGGIILNNGGNYNYINFPRENNINQKYLNKNMFNFNLPRSDKEYYTFSFKFAFNPQILQNLYADYKVWLQGIFSGALNSYFQLVDIRPIGSPTLQRGFPVQLIYRTEIPINLIENFINDFRFRFNNLSFDNFSGNRQTLHDCDILFYDFQLQRGYYSAMFMDYTPEAKILPYVRNNNALEKRVISKPAQQDTIKFYLPYSELILDSDNINYSNIYTNKGTLSWVIDGQYYKWNIDFLLYDGGEYYFRDPETQEEIVEYKFVCYKGDYLLELDLVSTDFMFIENDIEVYYEGLPFIAPYSQYEDI
jgi:hypothetical protein